MRKELINNLVLLRLVVGYLGEKDQFNWWPSTFLNKTTQKMLEYTFPRTASLAQYEGVSASAAKIHDERIGVGETFHLFRLPEYLEKSLVNHYQTKTDDIDFTAVIHSKDEALETLTTLAGAASLADEGPVNVGAINDSDWSLSINKIASSYLTAFTRGKQSFPYFGMNAR
jgi:hypothetical protein